MPQSALLADQQGTYLFVARTARPRSAASRSAARRADAVLDDGLSGGEQVIVQGMESLRPGAAVTATPVRPRQVGADPMLSSVFVQRPRLAAVIAIVTTIAGLFPCS